MENRKKYKKNYSESEILALTPQEIERIERVNESFEKREQAEANKESQLKMRILFERTAADMLPFVIYCITFAPIATYSLFKIMDLKGTLEFYWGMGGLLIIMILPLLILPRLPFTKWFFKKETEDNKD